MKTIALGIVLVSCAISASALEKGELDDRIRALTARFAALQQMPEKRVPPDVLREAKGIILLDRTKAGFLFAYQGGSGVALAKDPKTDRWSAPAFVSANEASLGFQIGAEQNFFVILLMNTNANRYLTEPNFDFGGEARGTAGDSSAGASGTVASGERPILVYDERKGLYAGAALKGGAIAPDESANRIYYGGFLTMKDILFDKRVEPTQPGLELAAVLVTYSNKAPPGQTAGR